MAYGIQSPPRQPSLSVCSFYLGVGGKSHWKVANELAWKPYWVCFKKWT